MVGRIDATGRIEAAAVVQIGDAEPAEFRMNTMPVMPRPDGVDHQRASTGRREQGYGRAGATGTGGRRRMRGGLALPSVKGAAVTLHEPLASAKDSPTSTGAAWSERCAKTRTRAFGAVLPRKFGCRTLAIPSLGEAPPSLLGFNEPIRFRGGGGGAA